MDKKEHVRESFFVHVKPDSTRHFLQLYTFGPWDAKNEQKPVEVQWNNIDFALLSGVCSLGHIV